MVGASMGLMERFMDKVEPEPMSGCWLWRGAVRGGGYGEIGIGSKTDKTASMRAAHRVSYELFVGKIPPKMNILHSCDMPLCVNPDHLFVGTQADNCRDRARKGRGKRSISGLPYGVFRNGKRFSSKVYVNKTYIYFGTFDTKEEAGFASASGKMALYK